MRCYLKGELRTRFHLAWFMVPSGLRPGLGAFLRSVRAVPSLGDVAVRLSDGTRARVGGEGDAVLLADLTATPPRGWLLIREEYGRKQEEEVVVGAILHELAHAFFHLEDAARSSVQPANRAEAAAWLLAASWAAHGSLLYGRGLDLVCHAVNRADRGLDRWDPFPTGLPERTSGPTGSHRPRSAPEQR